MGDCLDWESSRTDGAGAPDAGPRPVLPCSLAEDRPSSRRRRCGSSTGDDRNMGVPGPVLMERRSGVSSLILARYPAAHLDRMRPGQQRW